jgi:cation diffusion facilitator family transporter
VSKSISTKRVLVTSFLVDSLDVLINIVIAVITGSAVMLAEALQGAADLTSVGMLLIGFRSSKKRSNKQHPFGYGKEQYFWSLIAVFLIIGVTSTVSFYSGLHRWLNPDKIEFVAVAYIALIVSVFSNGYAFMLSFGKLRGKKSLSKLPREFIESSDVAARTTLVLDGAGTLAAIFGLGALLSYGITGNSKFDGLGAMAIGVLLLILALVLLFSIKGLVTGRSASNRIKKKITCAALEVPQVNSVLDLRTMVMGPESLLINVKIHIKDDLSTDEVEKVIDAVRENISKNVAGRIHLSVEPETPPKPRRKNKK